MMIAIISVVIVVILAIAYLAVGKYFYNYALNANKKKEFLENNPNLSPNKAINTESAELAKQADKDFERLHIPLEVSVVSEDKFQLNLNAYVY